MKRSTPATDTRPWRPAPTRDTGVCPRGARRASPQENDLDEVRTTRPTGLAELCVAADVQRPDVAPAAYDDVQAFHGSVIDLRLRHIGSTTW